MSSVNPYEAPQASLQRENLNETFDETSPFSAAGRFGRANYLAYSLGLYLIFMLVVGAVTAATSFMGDAASMIVGAVTLIAYVALFGAAIIFMIRRLHDLNWSGWLSVLTVVPLANLIIAIPCLFFRGTSGPNNYGPPPKPNKTHVAIATVFVLVFVIGIVAAIAIPAYQQYTQKAQEMSQGMPQ
jgi:uncharacterized membrane protein YhaH (DUF805 family)